MTASAEATLGCGQLGGRVAAIEASGFFALPDVHDNWKDCSRSKTTITLGGRTKTVRDGCVGAEGDIAAVSGEKGAERIEKRGDEIDRIVGSDRWIGPESKRQ